VLPDDSARPILDLIDRARSSIRLKMFIFSDPGILESVIAAHSRGVKVRIMLNPSRRNGQKENDASRKALLDAGIDVIDSNPAYALTHEKSMVIDDERAFVASLNLQTKNLTVTRDYAVVTHHRHEVAEIIECFEADWHRTAFLAGDRCRLIWCVGNGRERLGQLIDDAKTSLWLQNERYQDPVILEHLVRANQRGVKIYLMAQPPHKLKREKLVEGVSGLRILQDVGVKIHKLHGLKLHAKLMLADTKHAIVGSINLAPGSFDSRRELAIAVDEKAVLHRLQRVLHHDWANSKAIDLSDDGLLAELRGVDSDVVEDLALTSRRRC
jgi:phosphatidylserine/phosphatidylglycerophosphate/cardiolipin synthase-like enzyme